MTAFGGFAPPATAAPQPQPVPGHVAAATVNPPAAGYDMERINNYNGNGNDKSPRHRKLGIERKTAIGILISFGCACLFFGVYMGYQHAAAIERVTTAIFGG